MCLMSCTLVLLATDNASGVCDRRQIARTHNTHHTILDCEYVQLWAVESLNLSSYAVTVLVWVLKVS
jgi:hypothetical protein